MILTLLCVETIVFAMGNYSFNINFIVIDQGASQEGKKFYVLHELGKHCR